MIAYNNNGQLITLASGQRMWIGTSAAHEAAIQAGTMPNNCTVAIIDEAQSTLDAKPRSTGNISVAGNIALPSAGLTYTASEDGLVIVHAYKKTGGNTLQLHVNGHNVDNMPFNVPTMLEDCYGCQIILTGYVRKGDTFKITSDGNQSLYWIQKVLLQRISWMVPASGSGGSVVDEVENGNMNPVTSNAVYDALPTFEQYVIPLTYTIAANGCIELQTDIPWSDDIIMIPRWCGTTNVVFLNYFDSNSKVKITLQNITSSTVTITNLDCFFTVIRSKVNWFN